MNAGKLIFSLLLIQHVVSNASLKLLSFCIIYKKKMLVLYNILEEEASGLWYACDKVPTV